MGSLVFRVAGTMKPDSLVHCLVSCGSIAHEKRSVTMDYSRRLKSSKRRPIIDMEGATVRSVRFDREAIKKIIPNREPFLFLDAITGIDLENRAIIGGRKIAEDDSVFQGHFPGNPVYPGVLQLEIIAELFCCLYYFVSQNSVEMTDSGPVLLSATRMHDAVLQKAIFPGDELVVLTQVLELTPMTFTGIGQILTRGETAVAVIGEFYIVD